MATDKKQVVKGLLQKAKASQGAPRELPKLKTRMPIPNKGKVMPLPNKDKRMPILKDKVRKAKQPKWMDKDYQPGSIMRGYTKYA